MTSNWIKGRACSTNKKYFVNYSQRTALSRHEELTTVKRITFVTDSGKSTEAFVEV
jgi:hypothetical protein